MRKGGITKRYRQETPRCVPLKVSESEKSRLSELWQIIVSREPRHKPPPLQPKGKPEYRAAVNLQPVIREYVRAQNLAGQGIVNLTQNRAELAKSLTVY